MEAVAVEIDFIFALIFAWFCAVHRLN